MKRICLILLCLYFSGGFAQTTLSNVTLYSYAVRPGQKIAVITRDSSLICQPDTCFWQIQSHVDSVLPKSNNEFVLKLNFTLFNAKNDSVWFSSPTIFTPAWSGCPHDWTCVATYYSVDSLWGDIATTPGIGKNIYIMFKGDTNTCPTLEITFTTKAESTAGLFRDTVCVHVPMEESDYFQFTGIKHPIQPNAPFNKVIRVDIGANNVFLPNGRRIIGNSSFHIYNQLIIVNGKKIVLFKR
jgi:hypothetical protein